jgi:hypothetical protein
LPVRGLAGFCRIFRFGGKAVPACAYFHAYFAVKISLQTALPNHQGSAAAAVCSLNISLASEFGDPKTEEIAYHPGLFILRGLHYNTMRIIYVDVDMREPIGSQFYLESLVVWQSFFHRIHRDFLGTV